MLTIEKSVNHKHKSFLIPFFKEMNIMYPEKWCVLHSYETLPYYSESDVDMAFSGDNIGDLEKLIVKIAKRTEWQIYQKLWYDSKQCFYYVLKNNSSDVKLAIDFLIDNEGIGRYGFKTSVLTSKCDTFNEIVKIPNSEVAFSYKFVKRIVKKIPIIKDEEYLLKHYNMSDTGVIDEIMQEQFGKEGADILRGYFENKVFLLSNKKINILNKIKKNRFNLTIIKPLQKLYWESRRFFDRIFYPCGIIVYVPNLSDDDIDKFKEILSKKFSILFRFVEINHSSSIKNNLKSLVGSTLIISPVDNFNKNCTIQKHWLFSKYASLDEINVDDWSDIDKISQIYYEKILEILLKRGNFFEKYNER